MPAGKRKADSTFSDDRVAKRRRTSPTQMADEEPRSSQENDDFMLWDRDIANNVIDDDENRDEGSQDSML